MRFNEPNFGGLVLLVLMGVACMFLGRLVPGRRALAGELAITAISLFVGQLLSWTVNEGPNIGGLFLIPAGLGVFGTFFAMRIFEYFMRLEEFPAPVRHHVRSRGHHRPLA